MSRTARSIFALVMALTFLLGTGAAHALPSANGPAVERGTMSAVWDWLASVFDAKDAVARFFDAATGDNTQKSTPPSSSQSDFGGFIDPNGGS